MNLTFALLFFFFLCVMSLFAGAVWGLLEVHRSYREDLRREEGRRR